MRKIEKEIEEEIISGQFNSVIREKCQWCGEPIPGTMNWYITHGNMCQKCTNKAVKRIEERKKENKKNGIKMPKRKGL